MLLNTSRRILSLSKHIFSKITMSTATKTQGTWPSFFLFGDSLTQFSFSSDGRWGALLADHLQRKCDVINRGFSGYNSRWCKLILPKMLTADQAKNITGITLFLGANDSNNGDSNPQQHVPLNEFTENMTDIIKYLQSIGIERERIILISPPAYDYDVWSKECEKKGKPCAKTLETTGKYAASCVQISRETGVIGIDLYSEMLKNENWKEMLIDGLHLSAAGSTLLFDLLKPHVDKITADIGLHFPLWGEVDYKNPASSF